MKRIRSAAALAAAFAILFTSSVSAVGSEQKTIQKYNMKPASYETVSALTNIPSSIMYGSGIRTVSILAGGRFHLGNGIITRSAAANTTYTEKTKGSALLSFTVIDKMTDAAEQAEGVSEGNIPGSESSEREELRAYALETQDAQCLRYLHELEESGADSINGSRKLAFYGADDLVHNSRFDGVYKDYGIDVSYFQPNIDWNKVKNDGVTFAVIRLGYRSYVKKGPLVVDRDFYKNIQGAKNAGIQVGVYFYTQATTPEEAREEADFVVSTLGGADLDLPVFYDIETADFAPEPGRLDSAGLTVAEKTQLCRSFCDRIVEKGYWSSIYANYYWLTNMIDGQSLSKDYPIWVATYGKSTAFTGQYDMWQYSSKGSIDGISGNVDLNVRYAVDHSPAGVPTVKFSNGKLNWDAVSGADGYEVYAVDSSDNVIFLADAMGTSFDVTDPKYSAYFIKPFDLYGGRRYTGKASEEVDAVGRVGDIKCERIGIDKVRFSWDSVEGASGYEVYTDIGSSESLLCDTDKNYAELSGKDLQDHQVKIRAYNSARVYGKFSVWQHIKGNMPDKDIELRCDSGVLLWNVVDDADGYTVFSSSNANGDQSVDTKALFFCTNNEADTNFTVKAYCTLDGKRFYSGCSDTIEIKAVTAPPKGKPAVSVTGGDKPALTWGAIDGADGYTVFKRDNLGYEFEIAKTDTPGYDLEGEVEGKYYVKPYAVSGGEIIYGEASDFVGFFDARVTDIEEIITDDDHCIIKWSCSQYCSEYKIFTDGELLSSVSGDMAVIDKQNISNVMECIVIPFRYDDGVPMYGTAARLPR